MKWPWPVPALLTWAAAGAVNGNVVCTPGPPITPARLAGRLRALGIPVQAARRAALTGLATQLPAAVLADILGLQPGTAVRWMRDAGADRNRYAADLREMDPRIFAPGSMGLAEHVHARPRRYRSPRVQRWHEARNGARS